MVGHTHEDIDGLFGVLSHFRTSWKIVTPLPQKKWRIFFWKPRGQQQESIFEEMTGAALGLTMAICPLTGLIAALQTACQNRMKFFEVQPRSL